MDGLSQKSGKRCPCLSRTNVSKNSKSPSRKFKGKKGNERGKEEKTYASSPLCP
jgi:hypothetical protein